jgi:hypothetical protein
LFIRDRPLAPVVGLPPTEIAVKLDAWFGGVADGHRPISFREQ